MRPHILIHLLIVLGILLFSCSSNTNNATTTISAKQKIIKKLSTNSDYQISIWEDYSIKENNGPDFTVYYIYPTDTTKKLFGHGGIYFGGHPQRIQPNSGKKMIKDTLLEGNLLGKNIAWTIFDYGDKISAETILDLGGYDKVAAFAYGNNYSDIYSLIGTLQSLKYNK